MPLSGTFLPPTPPSSFQCLRAVSCVPWGGRERSHRLLVGGLLQADSYVTTTVTTGSHAAVVVETRGCTPAAVTCQCKTEPFQSAGCPALGLEGPARHYSA